MKTGNPVGQNSAGVLHDTVAAARAQLDDLLAELEAGARFVDGIERGVTSLDGRLTTSQRHRDEMERLIGRLAELRDSVRQQRALMMELRRSFDLLRRQTAGRR
jgi:hypothetical protein